MATRGRKPKPTALKLLEGNPGKRPINANEPIPPKGNIRQSLMKVRMDLPLKRQRRF